MTVDPNAHSIPSRYPPGLRREAKAIVALAFRNGPIEDLHAGKICPTCNANTEYSHVTDAEMKRIMTNAVNHVARLLWLKQNEPEKYEKELVFSEHYIRGWDDPNAG